MNQCRTAGAVRGEITGRVVCQGCVLALTCADVVPDYALAHGAEKTRFFLVGAIFSYCWIFRHERQTRSRRVARLGLLVQRYATTVAILAQGTSWAVAVTQASFAKFKYAGLTRSPQGASVHAIQMQRERIRRISSTELQRAPKVLPRLRKHHAQHCTLRSHISQRRQRAQVRLKLR